MSLRVLVSGMVCGDPWQAGASWAVAQYVLGLRRLGHDVWLIEPIDGELDAGYAQEVVRAFDLDGRVAFVRRETGEVMFGVERETIVAHRFDALLNVAGMLQDDELVARIPVRVYLDLDPAFTQLWHAVEGIDMHFGGHTHFVTVGQAIGSDACPIPDCDVEWIHTVPPIVLEPWRGTVTTRRTAARVHDGRQLALVRFDRAWRCPIWPAGALDAVVSATAAGGDGADRGRAGDCGRGRRGPTGLEAHGWHLVDPLAAAGTPARYREFVRRSKAEIGFAKSGYVNARCGWFSDRSACYLAAASRSSPRTPVHGVCRRGAGSSSSPPSTRPWRRSRTSRATTRRMPARRALSLKTHLDSDRVLTRLLEQVGLG